MSSQSPTHPSFYQISHYELAKLAEVRASGSVYAVYLAIVGHGYGNKTEVWPSINRLVELLNGTLTKRTIERAMAFLSKHGFIKRKGHQQGRIKLLAKRAAAMVGLTETKASTTDETDEPTDETDGQREQRKRRNFFSARRAHKSSKKYRSRGSKRTNTHRKSHQASETPVLDLVVGWWLNGCFNDERLNDQHIDELNRHRRAQTDEWQHLQQYMPDFVSWAASELA